MVDEGDGTPATSGRVAGVGDMVATAAAIALVQVGRCGSTGRTGGNESAVTVFQVKDCRGCLMWCFCVRPEPKALSFRREIVRSVEQAGQLEIPLLGQNCR